MNEPTPAGARRLRMFPRRDFLRSGVAGAAGAVASLTFEPAQAIAAGVPRARVEAWLAQSAAASPEAMAAYVPVALTAAELATVRAAVGRIIPTDDLGPGADEAGVHIYIDGALAGPDAGMLPLYQDGLAALDVAAGGNGFEEADPEHQDAVLRYFETGDVDGNAGDPVAETDVPEAFFATLLEHTRQGMFGDPVYGGNANFVGWDLVRYPGIKLVWTEADQEINADVEPTYISVERYGGKGHE